MLWVVLRKFDDGMYRYLVVERSDTRFGSWKEATRFTYELDAYYYLILHIVETGGLVENYREAQVLPLRLRNELHTRAPS